MNDVCMTLNIVIHTSYTNLFACGSFCFCYWKMILNESSIVNTNDLESKENELNIPRATISAMSSFISGQSKNSSKDITYLELLLRPLLLLDRETDRDLGHSFCTCPPFPHR
eukprot:TRINITY_DN530_c0_g1_i4.p1 TRINITY_DN530_c0_g1~~TRINITY_DN530_c0_g1_i4.p1  ORF type:complete len:112 (-),score=4.17 TRINITY_DN530_c0_g1_i4:620-955(-)